VITRNFRLDLPWMLTIYDFAYRINTPAQLYTNLHAKSSRPCLQQMGTLSVNITICALFAPKENLNMHKTSETRSKRNPGPQSHWILVSGLGDACVPGKNIHRNQKFLSKIGPSSIQTARSLSFPSARFGVHDKLWTL
jgi:hypothetical protein